MSQCSKSKNDVTLKGERLHSNVNFMGDFFMYLNIYKLFVLCRIPEVESLQMAFIPFGCYLQFSFTKTFLLNRECHQNFTSRNIKKKAKSRL